LHFEIQRMLLFLLLGEKYLFHLFKAKYTMTYDWSLSISLGSSDINEPIICHYKLTINASTP